MNKNNTTHACVSHQHLQSLLAHPILVDLYRSHPHTIPLQRVTARLTQALTPRANKEKATEETRVLVSLLRDLAVEVDRIAGYTKTPAPPGDTIVFPRWCWVRRRLPEPCPQAPNTGWDLRLRAPHNPGGTPFLYPRLVG